MVGTIQLAKIYFTNEQDYKVRPIVVVKENQFNDLLVLPLTTNFGLNGVKVVQKHLETGKLKEKSAIISDKILTVHQDLLVRKIGKLKSDYFLNLKEKFCKNLGCS